MAESGRGEKPRKKILYGITKGTWGGAQRYVFDLASNLNPDEYEVVLMAGEPGALTEKLKEVGIRTVHIPGMGKRIRWLGELGLLVKIIGIIRKERPDVIHLNSPKMAGLGSFAGRLLRVPSIIVTVHGWSFREKRNVFARGLIIFFSWLTALLATKHVLIQAEDFRAARAFGLPGRFVLIRNGIGAVNFFSREEARALIRDRIISSGGKNTEALGRELWIGTIAELTENKNIPLLIEAARRIESLAPVIIIGGGVLEKELKAEAEKANLSGRLFFAGFMPDAARLLRAFDVVTLTSRKEGLPYVILEAGKAALPVIATDIPAVRDIIENGTAGLLTPPDDADALARSLDSLLADGNKREEFGHALEARINSRFRLETMVEETKRLYEA